MSANADSPRPQTWDQRVLALIDAGLDESQIDENLALTPTERIRKMARFLALAQQLRRATAGGLRSDPDRA